MIAFVGINAVLLRRSLAHGCNTKAQGKAWAISTELRQHRSIRIQAMGALSELYAVEPRLVGCTRPPRVTKSTWRFRGSPWLFTLKEFVLWMGFVRFLARPSGLLILQVFILCHCPLTHNFPEYFTSVALVSFRENASLPKSGMILGGWRNQS